MSRDRGRPLAIHHPAELIHRPHLFRLTAGALAKHLFLRRGATRHSLDAEIDGAPALDPGLPTTVAMDQLAEAVARFTTHAGPHTVHPAYGKCTHNQYERLHAMHLTEHLPGLLPLNPPG